MYRGEVKVVLYQTCYKGIMSEAELHFLRGRMNEGRLNKARRGELFSHASIGYVRVPGGLMLDPDEQAQGVVQQVQQGPARGPTPLQSSPVRSIGRTYRDLNPVMHQVTQQAMHRALAVELVEDQPHHRLDLLVRIDGRFAAGQRDVANGRRAKQLAAAGLVEPALVHPFLEDVQLGLAHCSFEPCYINHARSTSAAAV